MIYLGYLLLLLLLSQVFLVGGRELVTGGLAYYLVAGFLLTLASLGTILRRRSPAVHPEAWLWKIAVVPGVPQTLLASAYLATDISWLNLIAAKPEIHFSKIISLLSGVVYTILLYRLLRLQDEARGALGETGVGRKRARAIYAWVVLTLSFSLPVVGALAVTAIRSWNRPFPPSEFSAPSVALAWICMGSLFFGGVLFRPRVMSFPGAIVWILLIVMAILAMAAGLESIWRKDWYVYILTSVSFAGTAVGVLRIVDSIYAVALKRGSNLKATAFPA